MQSPQAKCNTLDPPPKKKIKIKNVTWLQGIGQCGILINIFYHVMNILNIKTMSMATTYPNITTRGQVPFTCSLGSTKLTVNMLEKYSLLYNYEYSLIRTQVHRLELKRPLIFTHEKKTKLEFNH